MKYLIILALILSPILVHAQENDVLIAEMRENLAFTVIALTKSGIFSINLLNNIITIYNRRMGTVGVSLSAPPPVTVIQEPKEVKLPIMVNPIYERLIVLNDEIKKLDKQRVEVLKKAEERAKMIGGSRTTIASYKRIFFKEEILIIETKLKAFREERRKLNFKYCGKHICIL